jgi:hypothetical protein
MTIKLLESILELNSENDFEVCTGGLHDRCEDDAFCEEVQ